MRTKITIAAFILILLISYADLFAQEEKQKGMPPAIVVVAQVGSGMIAPYSEFVGTVYYKEVSEVAAEVSGKVEEVSFEAGQRVGKKGTILVKLSSDLLLKSLEAAEASYEQTVSDLKKAGKDLERSEGLFREQLIPEESFDEDKFAKEALELKAASLRAEVERLKIELEKKTVRAPFEGIVLKRHIDRGEWLSPGSVVATLATDDFVDIIAEVPESIINNISNDMNVDIESGGHFLKGKVRAVIPRGEISTRTFPVKIRAKNSLALKEGMEARVKLPTGKEVKTLTVPRDAVITAYGNTVVYVVNDSKAAMIPVRIIIYKGMIAGIAGEGLKEGMKVVIKGNERLQPGQDVMIQQ